MASPLQPLYSKIEDRQIRLCDIAPRISDEPISCELRTVSLDENIEYDALSYVWGDANDQQVIWVNGLELHVTRNLATALTFMRADKVRTMWIDAICIYSDQPRIKHLRNLRFRPQLPEGIDSVSDRENAQHPQ